MSAATAHATRPKTGLLLLLISLVVSIGAYAMVGLGLRGRVPRDIVVYGLTLSVAYLLAWGVVRWVAPRALRYEGRYSDVEHFWLPLVD